MLKRFETVIEANIARTKLDAFGIPCFLTEENVTHMTNHLLSGGIRLHIFAEDAERATQIVMGDQLSKSDDGLLVCPRCHSRKIIRNGPEAAGGRIMAAVLRVLLGLTQPYYCRDCGHEFET